mgnify:FL=1
MTTTHHPFDGEKLAQATQQIPVSFAGWCLIVSLAVVSILTCTSLLIRHLYIAEAAYQFASRV